MHDEPGPAVPHPSGRQFVVSNGPAHATVTEVGASLREFAVGGVPVVFGYGKDEICHGGKGQVLAPWPNRLEDGRYSFAGTSAVAALDEPENHNAIHGLVRWLRFDVARLEEAAVTLSTELMPQPGYPWRLMLAISYTLASDRALEVGVRAEGRSTGPLPFGIGFHPYLHPGGATVDDCELVFGADQRLLVDGRGLPRATEEVAGGEHDFSDGRSLMGRELDDCYTGLGADGRWLATLKRADGRSTVLRSGGDFSYLMCFTADTLPAHERRRALALEPMTCPPNALRSAQDLIVLEEGEVWSGSWSLELVE